MNCKKHLFSIPDELTYLNCAYKGPQTKRLEAIGIETVRRQNHPYSYSIPDFFEPIQQIKVAFSQLIENNEPDRIAIIPSASYGLANAARNANLKKGDKMIMAAEQFPSNVYPWAREIEQSGAIIEFIKPPTSNQNRAVNWNNSILDAINEQTRVVALGHVHWADGTLFDLKAIRAKTKKMGALLIIDGTQSVGALPFSVKEIQPDALICGSYKWMMGPYSMGVAYYGEAFDNGIPIEENWVNRLHSEDFTGLVNYQPKYRPMANRYSVGEQSNFILAPILLAAIEQLNEWRVENIQQYCKKITTDAVAEFRQMNLHIEEDEHRSYHLFGIKLNNQFDSTILKQELEKNKVLVSFRGSAMRVAPNIYNDENDLQKLVNCFKKAWKKEGTL